MRLSLSPFAAAALAAAACLSAASAASAQAQRPPSPPVLWAGCAGALALASERTGGDARGRLAAGSRRALAQARIAHNPQGLSPAQISGVALTATRSFRTRLAGDESRAPEFNRAVKLCTDALAKLKP